MDKEFTENERANIIDVIAKMENDDKYMSEGERRRLIAIKKFENACKDFKRFGDYFNQHLEILNEQLVTGKRIYYRGQGNSQVKIEPSDERDRCLWFSSNFGYAVSYALGGIDDVKYLKEFPKKGLLNFSISQDAAEWIKRKRGFIFKIKIDNMNIFDFYSPHDTKRLYESRGDLVKLGMPKELANNLKCKSFVDTLARSDWTINSLQDYRMKLIRYIEETMEYDGIHNYEFISGQNSSLGVFKRRLMKTNKITISDPILVNAEFTDSGADILVG